MVIPRGGRELIQYVRREAKVPCIETGAGVVNTYFDQSGDLEIGKKIIDNAQANRNVKDIYIKQNLGCAYLPQAKFDTKPYKPSGPVTPGANFET